MVNKDILNQYLDLREEVKEVQIDVITNTRQSDAKGILAIVSEAFKKMQFQIISMPEFKNDNEKRFRSTARFRRVIGSNERLI